MSLPKQLLDSFETIKSSRVVFGDLSKDALREFVDLLNASIPSPYNASGYAIYRFNRIQYLSDREWFVQHIKDHKPYDALILWTDFSHILAYFGLTGKIFLGWDKIRNKYRACPLTNKTPIKKIPSELCLGVESIFNPTPEDIDVSFEERDMPRQTEPNLDTMAHNIEEEQQPNLDTIIGGMESDHDIVFNRMATAAKRMQMDQARVAAYKVDQIKEILEKMSLRT